ncbi:MAG: type II secretion system protein GspK [Comamonas sp.]
METVFASKSVRGMALVLVLWTVAALGIAVTGVIWLVRGEVRQAGAQRDQAVYMALGRAAMVQVAQELVATGQKRLDRPVSTAVVFDGSDIDVLAVPLNGWADLNRAPQPLLAALLEYGAGLDEASAQMGAAAIVARRSAPLPQGGATQFDAVEDLLQLPGIDYDAYARLAPLVTVDAGGDGQVNAYAAPPAVLMALSRGNQAAVSNFLAVRETGQGDVSSFNSAFLTSGGSSVVRLRAKFKTDTQLSPVIVCDVSLVGQDARSVPWNFLQCNYRTSATW